MHRLFSISTAGLTQNLRPVAAVTILGICQLALLSVGTARANTSPEGVIEQKVLASVHRLYGGSSKVITHLPLTDAFATASQWELVVAKETDLAADSGDPNPTTICFVQNGSPNCAERVLMPIANGSLGPNSRLFYEFRGARLVYAGARRTSPLLMITACSLAGLNGNCGIYTLLFQYDEASDQFRLVFHDVVPRNNNGATRFMDTGPLRGTVVSVTPTSDAPYAYSVSVYRQIRTGQFAQILRYRSKTRYNDGNRLAVADSDMPEILRRLAMWKSTDPLPVPSVLPPGCTKLVLRNGAEWCE